MFKIYFFYLFKDSGHCSPIVVISFCLKSYVRFLILNILAKQISHQIVDNTIYLGIVSKYLKNNNYGTKKIHNYSKQNYDIKQKDSKQTS